MSIALIDQDALANKKDFFYDLDIMKLASYYKSKKEITKLLLVPSEYYQYTTTFYTKNHFDYKFVDNLFTDPRFIYRGRAFSPSEYEPLELDVEYAKPNLDIYHTYLKYNDKIPKSRIPIVMGESISTGAHFRLSTNNTNCNVPLEKLYYNPGKAVYIYDYSIFNYSDWQDALKNFKGSTLNFKFPQFTEDFDAILTILSSNRITAQNYFILANFQMDQLQDIVDRGKNYKDTLKVEIFSGVDPKDTLNYERIVIEGLNTTLALKHMKTRIHAYIDPRYIDEKNVFLNNVAYWSNRNHGDISLYNWLVNIRNRKKSTNAFIELAESNEIIKELLHITPSQWRSVL